MSDAGDASRKRGAHLIVKYAALTSAQDAAVEISSVGGGAVGSIERFEDKDPGLARDSRGLGRASGAYPGRGTRNASEAELRWGKMGNAADADGRLRRRTCCRMDVHRSQRRRTASRLRPASRPSVAGSGMTAETRAKSAANAGLIRDASWPWAMSRLWS